MDVSRKGKVQCDMTFPPPGRNAAGRAWRNLVYFNNVAKGGKEVAPPNESQALKAR